MKRFSLHNKRTTLKSFIIALILLPFGPANAQLDFSDWQNYKQLAEQGAICSGFASIMETQDVISGDIGRLWAERRKFSGAIIRNAARLEKGIVPDTNDINATISTYREWIFSTLVQSNEDEVNTEQSDVFANGQEQIRQLLKINCDDVFKQADKAILGRFPELANVAANKKTARLDNARALNELLSVNVDLNRQLAEANKQIEALQQLASSSDDMATRAIDDISDTSNSNDITAPVQAEPKKAIKIATPLARPIRPETSKQSDIQTANTQSARLKVTPIITPIKKSQPETKKPSKTGEKLFTAQLGTFKREALAANMISALKSNKPALFDATPLLIEGYAYPSGTTYYRVVTAPIRRIDAKTLCELLWTERIGCLIKAVQ